MGIAGTYALRPCNAHRRERYRIVFFSRFQYDIRHIGRYFELIIWTPKIARHRRLKRYRLAGSCFDPIYDLAIDFDARRIAHVDARRRYPRRTRPRFPLIAQLHRKRHLIAVARRRRRRITPFSDDQIDFRFPRHSELFIRTLDIVVFIGFGDDTTRIAKHIDPIRSRLDPRIDFDDRRRIDRAIGQQIPNIHRACDDVFFGL